METNGNMSKLFLPYELAVIAKEKGFYRQFIAYTNTISFYDYINGASNPDIVPMAAYDSLQGNKLEWITVGHLLDKDFIGRYIVAPLYQQIVEWFRENHNIIVSADLAIEEKEVKLFYVATVTRLFPTENKIGWNRSIELGGGNGEFKTPALALNVAIGAALKLI